MVNGDRERERVEKEMGREKGSLSVLYKAYMVFFRQVIRLNLTAEQVHSLAPSLSWLQGVNGERERNWDGESMYDRDLWVDLQRSFRPPQITSWYGPAL